MIDYSPFWSLLKEKGIKVTHLSRDHRINPKTIQAMRENKPISMRTVDELCQALKCNVGDIVKIYQNEIAVFDRQTGETISVKIDHVYPQLEKDARMLSLLKYSQAIIGVEFTPEQLEEKFLEFLRKTSAENK